MREKVKLALRLTTSAFDAEVDGLIAACLSDLKLAGVTAADDLPDDPLIERAVLLYGKGNFGYIKDGERYRQAYDMLKCSLALAGDYHAVE